MTSKTRQSASTEDRHSKLRGKIRPGNAGGRRQVVPLDPGFDLRHLALGKGMHRGVLDQGVGGKHNERLNGTSLADQFGGNR